jgi:hypothetical protein
VKRPRGHLIELFKELEEVIGYPTLWEWTKEWIRTGNRSPTLSEYLRKRMNDEQCGADRKPAA